MNFRYDIQTEAIISAGLQLLREKLGVIETEIFLLNVNRKGFDYTEWRERLYEGMTLTGFLDYAADAAGDYVPPERAEIV